MIYLKVLQSNIKIFYKRFIQYIKICIIKMLYYEGHLVVLDVKFYGVLHGRYFVRHSRNRYILLRTMIILYCMRI